MTFWPQMLKIVKSILNSAGSWIVGAFAFEIDSHRLRIKVE